MLLFYILVHTLYFYLHSLVVFCLLLSSLIYILIFSPEPVILLVVSVSSVL